MLLMLLMCGVAAAQVPAQVPAQAPAPAPDPGTAKAEASAKAWLVLVDSGKYGLAWAQAATEFQTRLREADWEQGAAAKLGPTGGVTSRVLRQATPTDNIEGAPPGHYVTLQYYTQFKSADPANEFVTMFQDKGNWKVVGYGLQSASAAPPPPPGAPMPAPKP